MNDRDEFAKAAMGAFLSREVWDDQEAIANLSYAMADAMLAARGDEEKPLKKKTMAEMPAEARRIMNDRWIKKGAEIPKSAHTDAGKANILDTLRAMNEVDKLSWDEIGDIVEYAATNWYPQYMKSPTSLRKKTTNGDCARWEAIKLQMENKSNGKVGQSFAERGISEVDSWTEESTTG